MIYIALILAAVGACLGSFINAFVWRLKTGRNWVRGRSECENCHHKLGPKDLVPLFSWIGLLGKCRYCKKPISIQNPLVELGVGALFVISYYMWPQPLVEWFQIVDFGLWLVFIVLLTGLFLYDLRWYILPDKLIYPLIGLGVVDALIRAIFIQNLEPTEVLLWFAYGLFPITGLYGLLYLASKGRWVGLGDVKLGIFIGLVLGWPGAVVTLLIANIVGTLVVIPGLLSHTLTRKSRIPFGPFLIVGFVIAGLYGGILINWYLHTFVIVY